MRDKGNGKINWGLEGILAEYFPNGRKPEIYSFLIKNCYPMVFYSVLDILSLHRVTSFFIKDFKIVIIDILITQDNEI